MTTKGSRSYTSFKFKINDTLLFGRESAGVPEKIHRVIKNRLKIPMIKKKRSLNLASSVAIVLAENLRQNKFINHGHILPQTRSALKQLLIYQIFRRLVALNIWLLYLFPNSLLNRDLNCPTLSLIVCGVLS